MACGWCISDTRGGGSHDFSHRPIFPTGDITIIRLHCDKKHEANIRSCGISNMCSSLYYWLQINFPSNFVASLIGKEMIGVVSTASKKQKCSEWLSHLINHMPFPSSLRSLQVQFPRGNLAPDCPDIYLKEI